MKKKRLMIILSAIVAIMSCTAIIAYAAMTPLTKNYNGSIKITGNADVSITSVFFGDTDLTPDGSGNLDDIDLSLTSGSVSGYKVAGTVAFKVTLVNNGLASATVAGSFSTTGADWLELFANDDSAVTAAVTYTEVGGEAADATIASGETVVIVITLTAIDFAIGDINAANLAAGLGYEITITANEVE